MNARVDTESLRDAAIRDAAAKHASAMRDNVLLGHAQTLETLSEELAHHMSQPGVTEQLIRSAESCGALLAGQMLLSLIAKGYADQAEIEAVKEVERMEAAGRANPDNYRPNLRQVRAYGEIALNA